MGLFGPDTVPPTRYNGLRTAEAILGTTLPIVIGQQRLSWKLIWYGDFQSSKAKQQGSGGSGLSKGGVQYVYTASVAGAISLGPCSNFLGVWDSIGKFATNTYNETFTLGSGSFPTYSPVFANILTADLGVGYSSIYSVNADDYGSPGSTTFSGTQRIPLTYTNSSTPGSGYYTLKKYGPFTLTSVDSVGTFTGTITGGASSNYAGFAFTITGFTNQQNNIVSAICTASSATTLSFNAITVAETDAASATGSAPYQYVFNGAQTGQVVTVTYVAYSYHIQENELNVVPSTPSGGHYQVTVQYQNEYTSDNGVSYYPSGVALTPVGNDPTSGPAGFYNPNGGNYLFSSSDAGVGVTINYTYTDPNPDTNTPNTFNLTFFSGLLGQAPWSYLTGKFPSAALGYSEIAYVASSGLYLGYSPVLPQYNFEILGSYPFGNGIPDANPADAIFQLLTNPTYKLNFSSNYIDKSLGVTGIVGPFSITSISQSGTSTIYHGTFPGGGSNAYEDLYFTATAFSHSVNDGTFLCIASSTTTITVFNTSGVNDGAGVIVSTNPSSARNMWTANNFFVSAILDSQSPVMNIIGSWCEAGQVYTTWDEGLLKFIPLVDTTTIGNGVTYTPPTIPIIDLDDNDFVNEKDKDPIEISQSPWQSRWNRIQVRWSVRSNDYNEDVLQIQDEASVQQYGLMSEEPKDWQFICTEGAAQFAANMRLQRFSAIYTTYSFTLKSNFAFLSPGDIITITDGLLGTSGTMFGRTPCRITKMTDDPVRGIIIEAENFPWSVGTALLYNKQAQIPSNTNDGPQENPGDTVPLIFEVPNRAKQWAGGKIYIFLNGQNANWGGAQAFVSFNGVDYTFYGQFDTPGRIGVTTADFPLFVGTPVLPNQPFGTDTTNTLTINMQQSGAVLQSVTDADLAANVTLSALVSPGVTGNTAQLTAGEGQTLGVGPSGTPSQGPNSVTQAISNPYYSANGPWANPGGVIGSSTYATATVTFPAGSVTAWFWQQDGSNAGIWMPTGNPSFPVSTGTAAAGPVTGNSLLFNPPELTGASDPNVQPIEWATVNGVGQITGYTQPWSGATNHWCMALLFQIAVPTSGHHTFVISHDDGMFFGIDGSASLVSGPNTTWHPNTAVDSRPVIGGFDQNFTPRGILTDTFVVNFPSSGVYNMEVDYFNWEANQTLTVQGPALSETSQFLDCTAFEFSIPLTGIGPVVGLQVSCTTYESAHTGTPQPTLYAVLLYNKMQLGTPVVVWSYPSAPTSPTTVNLGSATSLSSWGLTSGQLTSSIVNNASFGIRFYTSISAGSGSATAAIQDVQATVTWALKGGGAAIVWTNPMNVSSNSSYASAPLTTASQITQWLVATEFGFMVPFGFVLQGITVVVNAYTSSGSAQLIASIFTSDQGSGVGQRIGGVIQTNLTTSPADHTLGSINDLWGAQGVLDIDVLNSPGFGVAFQVVGAAGATVFIRNVRVTLTGESATNLELIAYEDVALVGQNTYAVTTINRGIMGSYPCDHPLGSVFARLDQATIIYSVDPTYTGSAIFFKFLSFNAYGNQLQTLSNVIPYEVEVGGLSPGAIDGATGSLITGTSNFDVPTIEAAMSAVHGSYGIQNIPSGYSLISPFVGTGVTGTATPVWTPLITGGGGAGGVANVFIVQISGDYIAAAWDYILTNTGGGVVTVSFPSVSANPNVMIGIKKVTSDSNVVVASPHGVDTVEGSASFNIDDFNEAIVFISDGVSNWDIFGSYYIPAADAYIYIPPIAGTYLTNQELYYSGPVRTITFPQNLTGSRGGCRVAPTGTVHVTLEKNGVSIGTVNIAASATTATFTFASDVTFNGSTDTFSIIAPATPDATFAGFWLDILASRVN